MITSLLRLDHPCDCRGNNSKRVAFKQTSATLLYASYCARRSNLQKLLDHIDTYRHFPGVRAEALIFALLAPYLRQLVEEKLGVSLQDRLLPEFPIAKRLLDSRDTTYQSRRVDYAIPSKRLDLVVMVECKGDPLSVDLGQERDLQRAQELGFGPIIGALPQISRRSSQRAKYKCLCDDLARAGLLAVNDVGEIQPTDRALEARVQYLFIEPHKRGPASMDFQEVAVTLRKLKDDQDAARLADFLAWWATYPAGSNKRFA